MSALPDLPLIHLTHGEHRLSIIDPRPNPLALGMRYTHGVYVAEWWHKDRLLTGNPQPTWNPKQGCGLPDIFERGLGVAAAREGEEFLRIGCGKLCRDNRSWTENDGKAVPVAWRIDEQGQGHLTMSCADAIDIGDQHYAYQLKRQVTLSDDGPTLSNELVIDVPWSEPVIWFAHPFFKHADGSGTSMKLPPESHPSPSLSLLDGRLALKETGGFGTVTAMQGARQPLDVELDERCGGGIISLKPDYGMDKLVIFATPHVFSVEPYLAHACASGERMSWSLAYRIS